MVGRQHTAAVVADVFDRMAWRDTYAQSAGLRELAEELLTHHAHAADLLADTFLAAYQLTGPRVREPADMAPSRLINHHIVNALVETPEFTGLRRETAGDPYAAALAVLAQAPALRELLDRSRDPGDDAARTTGAAGASDLAEAPAAAGGTAGAPPPTATPRPQTSQAPASAAPASQAAGGAARTAAAAVPGARAAARTAVARAAEAVRGEATLMRAWGVTPGELERMPFDRRARLAERLRTGRLARWAELIGRFREMADAERARKLESATGELVGVTLGDDLSRVIPSELAHLGLPELRAVFAVRYAAGELMLYDSRTEQSSGRGAVIACVDTSHSMYEAGPGGVTREAWAKACALALLDQARHERRDFVGILFSAADKLRVFRFPADRPADPAEVLDFAESFLGGGTSYQAPLTAAAGLLADEFDETARARGDIVILTDDECAVTAEWRRDWDDARRRLGFRLFGLAVGAPDAAGSGSVLEALCDDLRSVEDLTDVHAAAGLFRSI